MDEKTKQEVKYLLVQWDASERREEEWREKIHQEHSEQLALSQEMRKWLGELVNEKPEKS